MAGIVNRKLTHTDVKHTQVVEEITAPRESTLTALTPDVEAGYLIKYISGFPWTVRYFGQIVNDNTPLNHIDVKEGSLAKSYIDINNLTIMVQDTITHSYDVEQGVSTLSGSSVAPYGVRPYAGDVFIANVDHGEDVVFVVSNVERLSLRKDSLYLFSYNSLAWVNDNKEFLDKIVTSINETVYYDNGPDSRSGNLFLNSEEKYNKDYLKDFIYDSQNYYFTMFKQRSTASLIIPGQEYNIFDKIMNDFLSKTINRSVYDTFYTHDYSNYQQAYFTETILDAIINKVLPISGKRYTRKVLFNSVKAYFNRASMMSPGFSGMEYISMPDTNRDRFTKDRERAITESDAIDIRTDKNYDDASSYMTVMVDPNGSKSVKRNLPTLLDDDYYIVTKAFYTYITSKTGIEELSTFELMLYRYLNGDEIAIKDIVNLINGWQDWSYLHQYYVLPVIWVIIKNVLGVIW